jgi:hypothetical protein
MWATGITTQLEGKPHLLSVQENKGEPTDIIVQPVGLLKHHHLQTAHSHSHHALYDYAAEHSVLLTQKV